jgi:hypothetical protein
MTTKEKTATRDGDRGRWANAGKRALLWLTAVGLAIFPFPWW